MTYTEINAGSIMKVITSWEAARQRNGFDEQLGIDTLLALFQMDPQIKPVYGFAVDREVKAQGMQRMGILIHGLQVVTTFDEILSALGPDEELLAEVVSEIGERHCQRGLSPDHFTLLGRALLGVLETTMGDKWTTDIRDAWSQIIRIVNAELMKNTLQRIDKICHSSSVSIMQQIDTTSSSKLPRAA